jgi:acetolactate synthase I/II/III large subunit
MKHSNGADFFASFLEQSATSHVFFIPAIAMKSLAAMAGRPIRRIMVHGEKSAAYMADGYARAGGRPGVCMAQQIGASNLAAGLRDAAMGGSPVIAITGGPAFGGRYRGAYQEVEDLTQFDPVTKFNATVEGPARLPDMLRQAWREATSGSPGPVHPRWPGAHGESVEGDAQLELVAEPQFTRVPALRTLPDRNAITKAARLLGEAQRPIIVAGGGAVQSGAQQDLIALAQQLDIPVATSMNGKNVILDEHPLAAGVAGTYSRECANRAVHEADLVFFVGSRTGGQVTTQWTVPKPGAQVIQLDIHPANIGRNYVNVASLCGDAKLTLVELLAVSKPRKNPAWTGRVRELVREWRASAEPLRSSGAVPMRPERVCAEISRALPRDGVVVSDTGHSGMWSAAMIELTHPGQQYLRCAGSLGWALPAAIGAKCAVGDRAVVCWAGDGAAYYHLAELETAARYRINVVFVINNNSSLNQEIPLFDQAYGQRAHGDYRDLWGHSNVNFAEVAQALGCAGIRAETPQELQSALSRAFGLGKPVVIDAVTDVGAMAVKAWRPAGAAIHAH